MPYVYKPKTNKPLDPKKAAAQAAVAGRNEVAGSSTYYGKKGLRADSNESFRTMDTIGGKPTFDRNVPKVMPKKRKDGNKPMPRTMKP